MAKSVAQRQREYRERLKLKQTPKPPAKTTRERVQLFRQRKKMERMRQIAITNSSESYHLMPMVLTDDFNNSFAPSDVKPFVGYPDEEYGLRMNESKELDDSIDAISSEENSRYKNNDEILTNISQEFENNIVEPSTSASTSQIKEKRCTSRNFDERSLINEDFTKSNKADKELCDKFGNLIAHILWTMQKNDALRLQNDIHRMVTERLIQIENDKMERISQGNSSTHQPISIPFSDSSNNTVYENPVGSSSTNLHFDTTANSYTVNGDPLKEEYISEAE